MKKQANEDINVAFIGVYKDKKGTPDRVSIFVSTIENKMVDLKVWDNVDFNNEDSISAIEGELRSILTKYDAFPIHVQHLFTPEPCVKCTKLTSVMAVVEGEAAKLFNACFPCKTVGSPAR